MKNQHYTEKNRRVNSWLCFPRLNAIQLLGLLFAGLFVLSFGICSQSRASEDKVLYSIESNTYPVIKMLAPASATTTSEASIWSPNTRVLKASGLATHPTTGELWTILDLEDNERVLAVIDPRTGEVPRHWSVNNLNEDIVDLAFQPLCEGGYMMWFVNPSHQNGEQWSLLSMGLREPEFQEPDTEVFFEWGYPQGLAFLHNHAIANSGDCDVLHHASDACGSSLSDCTEIFEKIITEGRFSRDRESIFKFDAKMNGVTSLTYYDNIFYWADRSNMLWQVFTDKIELIGDLDHESKGLAFADAIEPPSQENINDFLELISYNTKGDRTLTHGGQCPGGRFQIRAWFRNNSQRYLGDLTFVVAKITQGNSLIIHDHPTSGPPENAPLGGVDTEVPVPDLNLGEDGVLSPEEIFPQNFFICLAQNPPVSFEFFVDFYR